MFHTLYSLSSRHNSNNKNNRITEHYTRNYLLFCLFSFIHVFTSFQANSTAFLIKYIYDKIQFWQNTIKQQKLFVPIVFTNFFHKIKFTVKII